MLTDGRGQGDGNPMDKPHLVERFRKNFLKRWKANPLPESILRCWKRACGAFGGDQRLGMVGYRGRFSIRAAGALIELELPADCGGAGGFTYLGADGNTYGGSMADYVGVMPDPQFSDIGEQFPNAVAEGYVGWSVPATAIRGGTIILDAGFIPESRVFYTGVR